MFHSSSVESKRTNDDSFGVSTELGFLSIAVVSYSVTQGDPHSFSGLWILIRGRTDGPGRLSLIKGITCSI